MPNSCGLYIHVPFCGSICHYCDFNRYLPSGDQMDSYPDLVLRELFLRSPAYPAFSTLFFGGGTPSLLPFTSWKTLLSGLSRHFAQSNILTEFSIEANPNQLQMDKLSLWKDQGLTRLSMGAQSFNTEVLKQLGRTHQPQQVFEWVEKADQLGLQVSIDLMFGLPGQSTSDWMRELNTALSLPLHHLSFYGLTVEPNTVFHTKQKQGILPEISEEYDDMYLQGVALAESRGLFRYETSNFAHVGKECKHNQSYWNHSPYLGLGPGAHSLIDRKRVSNPRSFAEYVQWVAEDCPSEKQVCENLDDADIFQEKIWLGLRQTHGCIWTDFTSEQITTLKNQLQKFVECGWIVTDQKGFRVVDRGWLYIDSITIELT